MEWIDGYDRAAASGGRRKRCPDFLPNEYPVIRLLRNGEEPGVDYAGPRTSEEYVPHPLLSPYSRGIGSQVNTKS